jgi:sugar lactone lactonase YvrE
MNRTVNSILTMAGLSLLALTAGVSTASAQTLLLRDDFNDNNPIGWSTLGGSGQFREINQQFVVSGSYGRMQTNNPPATHTAAFHSSGWPPGPLPDRQTIEIRADLVGANQNDAWGGIHVVWWGDGVYAFFKGQDEVALGKVGGDRVAWFFYENRPLKNQNVTLVLSFTRVGSDLKINTRVLDKDNANAVLIDRTVTDTPQADPVLPNRAVRGKIGMADWPGTPWPLVKAPADVELGMSWVNSQAATQGAAEVLYDNVEVWQYEPPELKIELAAIVSWPFSPGNWILESATAVDGRYAPHPQTPEIRDSRHQVIVLATNQAQFFRLSQLTAGKEVFLQGLQLGGTAFHSGNGINIDAAGRLYVASVFGGEIVILNRQDGAVIDRLGAAQGVLTPDDVIIGPDGSVYWTDLPYGQVGRRAPDGTVTKQLVAPGVNPITFSADGRLFVAQAFLGDGLWELDPNLQQPPKKILDAPGQLNGFAFGPDGKLYSPANALGALVRIDVDATTLTPVAALGTIAAVKFDAAQRLWLLSGNQKALLRVNRDSGVIEQTIVLPSGGFDNFVPGPNERFYVTFSDGGVLEVSLDGTFRQVQAGGSMTNPGGVAVAREGDQEVVAVADLLGMSVFDVTTGALRKRHNYPADGIAGALTVAPSTGGVLISSWLFPSLSGASVQEWDLAKGVALRQPVVTNVPLNVVEFQGKLVAAELATGSVAQFVGDDRTVLAEGLFVPCGLAASADNLYVADWASGLIHQVVAAGVKLTSTRIIAAGLLNPEGLALDTRGNLLVVETGTRSLVRVNVTTGVISTVATGLSVGAPPHPGMPPTWVFDGVAVAPSGAIYVSSYGENVVYRITE